jgi:hypothetical protein
MNLFFHSEYPIVQNIFKPKKTARNLLSSSFFINTSGYLFFDKLIAKHDLIILSQSI